jgi:hypothetical protein
MKTKKIEERIKGKSVEKFCRSNGTNKSTSNFRATIPLKG